MLQGNMTVKLGSIMIVTALMMVCVTNKASAADDDDWSMFDPFALDVVVVTQSKSIQAIATSSVRAPDPYTTISSLPVRGIGAMPVRTPAEEGTGTLRTPPVRIPIKPNLLTPFRPWGDC